MLRDAKNKYPPLDYRIAGHSVPVAARATTNQIKIEINIKNKSHNSKMDAQMAQLAWIKGIMDSSKNICVTDKCLYFKKTVAVEAIMNSRQTSPRISKEKD